MMLASKVERRGPAGGSSVRLPPTTMDLSSLLHAQSLTASVCPPVLVAAGPALHCPSPSLPPCSHLFHLLCLNSLSLKLECSYVVSASSQRKNIIWYNVVITFRKYFVTQHNKRNKVSRRLVQKGEVNRHSTEGNYQLTKYGILLLTSST
jgi:hypothetical protein